LSLRPHAVTRFSVSTGHRIQRWPNAGWIVTVDRRPLPDDDTEPCVAVVKDDRFLGALDADLVEQALSAIVA